MAGLEQTEKTKPFLSGSVTYVLRGLGDKVTRVKVGSLLFGIGAATPLPKKGVRIEDALGRMGETIVIGGSAYVRPTGKDFGSRKIESTKEEILTPFLAGIPAGAVPVSAERIDNSRGKDFGSLITQMSSYQQRGIAFAGILSFRELQTVAIKNPPNDPGLPLLTNPQLYWADPTLIRNQFAIVCGLAVDNGFMNPGIFYKNPNDLTSFQIHTHVLKLGQQGNERFSSLEAMILSEIEGNTSGKEKLLGKRVLNAIHHIIRTSGNLELSVGHLLNQSIVDRALFSVFPLA